MALKSGPGIASRLRRRLPWLIATAAVVCLALSLVTGSAGSLGSSVQSDSLRACSGTPTDVTAGTHGCN